MPIRSTLVVLCAALGLGCSREASPVLASGEGFAITADQFRASVNDESASVRGAYAEAGKKRELLEKLIDYEVLVTEARRQGLDRDPQILKAMPELMVQRLLRSRQSPVGGAPAEAELRALYEAQRDRDAVPATVRLLHLFLAAPEPAQLPARRAEAEALRTTAAALPAGAEGDRLFGELVRKRSDEAGTAAQGGDLTHRTAAELGAFYSAPVAEGAFALKDVGQTSAVLESARGLHLFRLLERTAGRVATFEEFRAAQGMQVARTARDEDLRGYARALRSKAKVVVREEELKQFDPLTPNHPP